VKKDFYSEYFQVEDKHWWFVGRRRILLALLDRFLPEPPRPPRKILDVGCGTGTMLRYLAAYGEIQGVDADSEAVHFCQMRGLENVSQLAGEAIPFADNSFDLITMFDVLEHIEDHSGALREIFRVLKRDGMLVLTVPAYRFLWGAQDEISHHKRRYRASEIKQRLHEAGMVLIKLSYFNTLLFPFIALIRLGRTFRRRRAEELKSDFTLTSAGPANELLARIFAWERHLVARWDLPFGVSIVGLARKKA
jgi:ubiquinone/menaquinone biosynthesis C-methylase UbiE